MARMTSIEWGLEAKMQAGAQYLYPVCPLAQAAAPTT
jgi:hypothetical protein